ncbi:BTAD domain-containing putative transcriptional regulator [Streptomyces sp. NPDC057403]|uniref:AfsR/SARP family transcriptional regulator n=1 Tax=Streptomyces sp. NPDC057403 TaxID=3346119 RepID=UPI00368810A0
MTATATEFRLLGPVEVHRSRSGLRVAPAGAKQRALLATLVVEAGRTVSVERLAEELWGAHPPRSAANAVQAHIARLRRLLAAADGPAAHETIVTEPTGYLLRLGEAATDAEHFRRLSAQGRAAAASDPDRAAVLLDRALSLWRGPALADCRDGSICAAEADRLEEQRLVVLEAFYEARLRSARSEGITVELERLAEEHPLRERFSELLMVALHRADRCSEALAVYERVRRRLAAELGVEPGPSLRGRREALLRQAGHSPAGDAGFGHCTDRAEDLWCGDPALRAAEVARIGRRLEELSCELRDLNRRFEALRADTPPGPRRPHPHRWQARGR